MARTRLTLFAETTDTRTPTGLVLQGLAHLGLALLPGEASIATARRVVLLSQTLTLQEAAPLALAALLPRTVEGPAARAETMIVGELGPVHLHAEHTPQDEMTIGAIVVDLHVGLAMIRILRVLLESAIGLHHQGIATFHRLGAVECDRRLGRGIRRHHVAADMKSRVPAHRGRSS